MSERKVRHFSMLLKTSVANNLLGLAEILPPGFRSVQTHAPARAEASRPQGPDSPVDGALQYEVHALRRVHIQRTKVQRKKGNYRREILPNRNLPVLHPMHAMLWRNHIQDRPKEHGLRMRTRRKT